VKKFLAAMRNAMSCEEFSRLASDSIDRDLSRSERLITAMHRVMCWPCCRFLKQLELIHEACQRQARGDDSTLTSENSRLSDQARERIAKAISGQAED
jgi:hypothetical protein